MTVRTKKILFFRKMIVAVFFLAVMMPCGITTAASQTELEGHGTYASPYLIKDVDDLVYFRDMVNSGNDFYGKYFRQETDLDLAEVDNWEPIGIYNSENYFYGIYDGYGHSISNLTIERLGDNAGLFGQLGGTVCNLGIESGSIESDCSGAIASHAVGGSALILNCYNMATVKGVRAGGIADNLTGGIIINCWNLGVIEGSQIAAGIVSYDAASVINCASGSVDVVPYTTFAGTAEKIFVINLDSYEKLYKEFKEQAQTDVTTLKQVVASLLEGQGTEADPYRIKSVETLCIFRDLVNAGYSFNNEWIRQERDLDLKKIDSFIPIGNSDNGACFQGVYDGNGHTISNLSINTWNAGFFGMLGGIVMNLGIESGEIQGEYAGAIASQSADISMIVNCFNNASVIGNSRAGGIADDLSEGVIANCYNAGMVNAPVVGGIVSYDAAMLMNCYTLNGTVGYADTYSGSGITSCFAADDRSAVCEALNMRLYPVATKTDLQHNNLNEWDEYGLTENKYNYRLRFFLTECLVIVLLLVVTGAVGVVGYRIYKGGFPTMLQIRQFLYLRGKILVIAVPILGSVVLMLVGGLCGDHMVFRALLSDSDVSAFTDLTGSIYAMQTMDFDAYGFYGVSEGAYPPVARLILWIMGEVLPLKIILGGASQIRTSTYFLLEVVAYEGLMLLALSRVWSKISGSRVAAIVMLFTSPIIYLMERGNIIFFALLFVTLFLGGYESEHPFVRHCSYLCLGLAAAIKIYPAVFGLLILKEKNKKHLVQAALYGAGVCILPFFAVGGFSAIGDYIYNVTHAWSTTGVNWTGSLLNYKEVIKYLFSLVGYQELGISIADYTFWPVILFLLVDAVFQKQKWKSILELVMIMIYIPGFSVYYMAAFYILPCVFWIATKKQEEKSDYIYIGLLLMILMQFQFLCGVYGGTRLTIRMIAEIMEMLLLMMLLLERIIGIVSSIYKKANIHFNMKESDVQ